MFHFLFFSFQPSHNKTCVILVLAMLSSSFSHHCMHQRVSILVLSYLFLLFLSSWEMISSTFRSWLTAFSILLSSDSCLTCVRLFVFSLIIIFSPRFVCRYP
ncbi:hypothetical protein BO83DRAFT_213856 [Aspergillus eucalypticola CBS 122712]|uniref:Uncharacterized protein n=1 Tax=Aspergillus eucalypticola (strain CBS 122712 / IBT 29274) TaxID=1448314 RepID=A0A317VWQ7_ASPEC|nr:uncharacterized protein BO83DRAFT_213856 [Aspergillus eucalypticola CBS 122712]PWY78723.1 hypothetical protein BO83DRAFT_213856 [Aspergillus eucalypticola CBS 122712]